MDLIIYELMSYLMLSSDSFNDFTND